MSAYDRWLEKPYDDDDIWQCIFCDEENNGGDECSGCGEAREVSEDEPDPDYRDNLDYYV